MYNCLFKCSAKSNILYGKRFRFRNSHSTEHTMIELVDEMLPQFAKNRYTLGIFVNLSKAFDTENHQILFKKLKLDGVTGNNCSWFENYLSNRKKCVVITDNENTLFQNIICGVPQGTILGPLLFILYINDLKNVSNALDPTVFADDTILFISDKNINTLFIKANLEL